MSKINLPDFLDKNGLELTFDVLVSDFALEVLKGQDALLEVLDVVSLFALYKSLNPT